MYCTRTPSSEYFLTDSHGNSMFIWVDSRQIHMWAIFWSRSTHTKTLGCMVQTHQHCIEGSQERRILPIYLRWPMPHSLDCANQDDRRSGLVMFHHISASTFPLYTLSSVFIWRMYRDHKCLTGSHCNCFPFPVAEVTGMRRVW
jgi:hypothetical protein